jgi:CheY-like chemotaxis protein
MKKILEGNKYEVIASTTGSEAFDADLKKQGFDLILIDVVAPNISGYDLLRLLNEKVGPKIPILFVTATKQSKLELTDLSRTTGQ